VFGREAWPISSFGFAGMIQKNESFDTPPNVDVSVWRYMDLVKFISILKEKALYFARADKLDDAYEGYYTAPMASPDSWIRKLQAERPDVDVEEQRLSYELILKAVSLLRKNLFVNCWHVNEEESLAMWKLYTTHGDSISIRSTYKILSEHLPNYCFLGLVKYIDYQRDSIPIGSGLNYIVHKRKAFEHERELRGVIWNDQVRHLGPFTRAGEMGIFAPIDVNALVKEIYVSPAAKAPLFEVVQGLCQTYGLSAPVKQSDVNAPPAF
jgi:hypothetical protein